MIQTVSEIMLKPQLINITINITNSTLYFRKFIFFLHKLLIQTHFLKNFDLKKSVQNHNKQKISISKVLDSKHFFEIDLDKKTRRYADY